MSLRGYPWALYQARRERGASEVESFVASWRYLIAVELAGVALRSSIDRKSTFQYVDPDAGWDNDASTF
jgi:hypothetical protein